MLGRVLDLAHLDMQIVLHIRGHSSDTTGKEAYLHVLDLVREKCTPDHKFQLHCFHGTEYTVEVWRKSFPNTYFSFSGKVRTFTDQQKDALQLIPSHRLLVETDSPYLGPPGVSIYSPIYIVSVARLVAEVRGDDLPMLLEITTKNARMLFTG
jgi:TatD DNase family protein